MINLSSILGQTGNKRTVNLSNILGSTSKSTTLDRIMEERRKKEEEDQKKQETIRTLPSGGQYIYNKPDTKYEDLQRQNRAYGTLETIGFRPKYVEVNYFVQGHDSFIQTSQYLGMKGWAMFSSTTMDFNNKQWDTPSVAGDGLTGDGGYPKDWPVAHSAAGSDLLSTTALAKGGAGSGDSDISATLTINAVSDTGFTFRCVTATGTGSTGPTGRCKASYKAYK